jgi:hypothetical protein
MSWAALAVVPVTAAGLLTGKIALAHLKEFRTTTRV